MNSDHVKEQLTNETTNYLQKIDILPLNSLRKIEIFQSYLFSKLKWKFAIYYFNETWVNQIIDNQFSKYYCIWLHLPVCVNITHLSLPSKKLGMNVMAANLIYNKCKTTLQRVLKCSRKCLQVLETKKLVNYMK